VTLPPSSAVLFVAEAARLAVTAAARSTRATASPAVESAGIAYWPGVSSVL